MKVSIQHGLSAVLAAALALAPLAAEAQQQTTPPPDANPPAQSPQTGTTVNPAQGPLEPVPSPDQNQLPANPQPQQQGQSAAGQQAPANTTPQQPNQTQPLGTAAAPGVSTVGGGASRPAGTAIAPAKQRQYRSLMIKLGLIAAAGGALGAVYALSKGTSSVPPGSGR
jgi:hypothetical protein